MVSARTIQSWILKDPYPATIRGSAKVSARTIQSWILKGSCAARRRFHSRSLPVRERGLKPEARDEIAIAYALCSMVGADKMNAHVLRDHWRGQRDRDHSQRSGHPRGRSASEEVRARTVAQT